MSFIDPTLAKLILSDQVDNMAEDQDKMEDEEDGDDQSKSLSRESRKYVNGHSQLNQFQDGSPDKMESIAQDTPGQDQDPGYGQHDLQ